MDLNLYKDKVYAIIGAAMTVHNELGSGLLEPIYNEALCIELNDAGINAVKEQEIQCFYKGKPLQKRYRMDIVVDDVVVELKSTCEILPEHRFQLFNYLRLTKKTIGLLINFGEKKLHCERYVYDISTNECVLLNKNMQPYYS